MQKAILRSQQVNLVEEKWKEKRDYLKQPTQKKDLTCPQCKEPVELHWAIPTKKTPHFKHKTKKDCIYGHGESEEHNAGKIKLLNYFREVFADKLAASEVEYFISESKQIADIFLQFKTGEQWVIEYQRSNIPSHDIQRRRSLYKSMGIKDIWIVGENLVTKEDLVTVNIQNAAQELICEDFHQEGSLLTYDPLTNQISIYRGLKRSNQRTYTKDATYSSSLNGLCFNQNGEPYVLEDYLRIIDKNIDQTISGLSMLAEAENLKHANKRNETYYIIDDEMYLSIPAYLHPFIPKEMRSLKIDLLWNPRPANSIEEAMPISVNGIYTTRWEESLAKKNEQKESFLGQPVYMGMMFSSLDTLYRRYLMTDEEWEKEIGFMTEGKQIPHYMQSKYLKVSGITEQDIWRNEFTREVSLEEACTYFLRVMGIKVVERTSIKIAISYGILLVEEVEESFILNLLFKMDKRIKRFMDENVGVNKWVVV